MNNIEKKVIINVPINKVWEALTDPRKLETWMLAPTDFEPEEGRKFIFTGKADENWDGIISCSVKEIVENKKLVFIWNSQLINAETLVSITLKESDEKTELTLVHSGWDKVPANAEILRGHHDVGWDLRLFEKIKELVEINNRSELV